MAMSTLPWLIDARLAPPETPCCCLRWFPEPGERFDDARSVTQMHPDCERHPWHLGEDVADAIREAIAVAKSHAILFQPTPEWMGDPALRWRESFYDLFIAPRAVWPPYQPRHRKDVPA